jgi:hypothetical protein
LNGRCNGTDEGAVSVDDDIVVDNAVDMLLTLETDFGFGGMMLLSVVCVCEALTCSLKGCSSSIGDNNMSLKGGSYIRREEESSNGKKYLSG